MISKIIYKNFKCFKEAELSFEFLTTVIGTNSSGKTNAIEGMMILSEIATGRDLSMILDGSKNGYSGVRGGAKACSRMPGSCLFSAVSVACRSDHMQPIQPGT